MASGLCSTDPVAAEAVEFDDQAVLVRAAAPVLDGVVAEIDGCPFAVVLSDSNGTIVDRRVGDARLVAGLDDVGGIPGARHTESVTGTNSAGLALRLGRRVSVIGDEHFLECFRDFACYGHPVRHPVTRQVEGVINLCCPADVASPAVAMFLARVAADIESRLLDTPATEQRMLAAYQVAAFGSPVRPVMVMNDRLMLLNMAAAGLLNPADADAVLALASGDGEPRERLLRLIDGRTLKVFARALSNADATLVEFKSGGSAPTLPEASIAGRWPDVEMARCRERRLPVLVAGEPGTGRTSALRKLAAGLPISIVDAAVLDEASWSAGLERAVAAGAGLLAMESIELLTERQILKLTGLLDEGRHWIACSSTPVAELTGLHRVLAARCVGRIELAPVRARERELPSLLRARLAALGMADRVKFAAGALQLLASHPWLGNFHELHGLVDFVLSRRSAGEIMVEDLPERYRSSPSKRRLTAMEKAEYDAIMTALRICDGNRVRAAQRLGISRSTLHRRIRSFGIQPAS
ncbi:helix-turn-helix domain-containing protein [Amycolatopsis sp. cg5]|uniref:helix-turn-helix domain-containing protein n=1 Tax=Amycolatopsis sp. cg5 TaxID=3238802 RepID=UPI0035264B6E